MATTRTTDPGMQEPGGQGGGQRLSSDFEDQLTLTQGSRFHPTILTPLRFSDLPASLNLSVAVRGTQREDSEAT